jgi:ABC-type polar amino acid transport system ATPase subunit
MVETTRLEPVIRCDSLAKSFNGLPVLQSISCAVGTGEVLAVMGRSGSGKSTFLRLLALLENPDRGNAWLNGQQYLREGTVIVEPVAIRRRVAMVFQHFNLFPNLSVVENCTLGPVRTQLENKETAKRSTSEMLDSLGLLQLANRYPETLSGGEAQRVALARALLMKPEVLLLDEVTSSLDPESIGAVLDAICKIRFSNIAEGIAIILVTHHLAFARSFAQRIAFIEGGTFVDVWPANEFADRAVSVEARNLVAQSWSIS